MAVDLKRLLRDVDTQVRRKTDTVVVPPKLIRLAPMHMWPNVVYTHVVIHNISRWPNVDDRKAATLGLVKLSAAPVFVPTEGTWHIPLPRGFTLVGPGQLDQDTNRSASPDIPSTAYKPDELTMHGLRVENPTLSATDKISWYNIHNIRIIPEHLSACALVSCMLGKNIVDTLLHRYYFGHVLTEAQIENLTESQIIDESKRLVRALQETPTLDLAEKALGFFISTNHRVVDCEYDTMCDLLRASAKIIYESGK